MLSDLVRRREAAKSSEIPLTFPLICINVALCSYQAKYKGRKGLLLVCGGMLLCWEHRLLVAGS
jgi:hypothetical protein